MKTKNKKGFGLIMAIMIVTVLFIMALGFFQVTDFSTKSTFQNLDNLRLYWAAESASNYNVAWWVNQDSDVRIDWPSVYSPSTTTSSSAEEGFAVNRDGFSSSSSRSSSWNTYDDINNYKVHASVFGEKALGIAINDEFYLHASSVVDHPNQNIDGYEIITARYKGARLDHNGEVAAVWVLDSYAWDPSTKMIANITLTNVFNEIYVSEIDLLANSENIVRSMYASGFNGALGAFHEKDIRYGPAYYADLMRFDMQTGGSTGPRFFRGPVKSSLVQSQPSFAHHQSRWGNAQIENMSGLFDTTHDYGYGVSIRKNFDDQDAAAAAFRTILNNGATPYHKDEPAIPLDNVVWTWQDVKDEGPSHGIFLLPEGAGGNVTVRLIYDSSTGNTTARITGGYTQEIVLGHGSGSYKGIAVPKSYGNVNLAGVSNKDFTLVTETSQVVFGGDFYIAGMQNAYEYLSSNTSYINQNQTPEWLLEELWTRMGNSNSETQLSVISQLNTDELPVDPPPPFYIPVRNRLYFMTAAFLSHDGFLSTVSNINKNTFFFNIGSFTTLNYQDSERGDASGSWTKALIQDQRYLDPDFGIPPFWGEGPSITEQYSLFGLNKEHMWSNSVVTKANDWRSVVWSRGNWGNPHF